MSGSVVQNSNAAMGDNGNGVGKKTAAMDVIDRQYTERTETLKKEIARLLEKIESTATRS